MAGGLAWMFTHHEWKKDNAGYTSGMGERKKGRRWASRSLHHDLFPGLEHIIDFSVDNINPSM